ncbi:MAG: homocitrate synthase [Armatimonadetes bacterium]|nr:homocitrate synthase [Armatimonadota bacterium]
MPKIWIVDVTNRDGEQTARIVLSKLQKTIINILLDEMGIYGSEFGFPLSPHEWEYINANVDLTRTNDDNGEPVIKQLRLEGWSRAVAADVEVARAKTNVTHLNLSISTSQQMLEWKFRGKFTPDDIIKMMTDAVRAALEAGCTSVGINAEDASRTDLEFLKDFGLAGKEAGAEILRYCDTLGYDDPFSIAERMAWLASEVQMPLETHCHNDLGLAVANSIAGAVAVCDAGQDAYINTTVNGVGERAGNADHVSVILALRHSAQLSERGYLDDSIDLSKAWRLAKYVATSFGLPIPINQVGVGANAFAHESGIHADGALKDRSNYELYDFEELGRGHEETIKTGREILTGQHGGTSGLEHVYSHLDLAFRDADHARETLNLVQYANLCNQQPLTEEELRFIYHYPEIARRLLTLTP